LVPDSAIDCTVTVTDPVFLRVTVCAGLTAPTTVLAKATLDGVRLTLGGGVVPVPDNVTFCGEPVALSEISSEPVSAPAAAGFISTDIVQLAPAATVAPQVVALLRKDEASVPVIVMPPVGMVRFEPPVFFSVTT